MSSVSAARFALAGVLLFWAAGGAACSGSSQEGMQASSGELGQDPAGVSEADSVGADRDPGEASEEGGEPDAEVREGPFAVGFDVAVISPSEAQLAAGDIYMGAYGAPLSRGAAQGVHDDVYARAMAIEQGGVGVLLTVLDLPGMGNRISRAIRAGASERTGVPEEAILVGTTHSHSAPDLMGLWGGVSEAYRDDLIEGTVASLERAWASRVEATLRVGAADAPNRNRRGWEDSDESLVSIEARDGADALIGLYVCYAAHPVILGEDNKLISRDYNGYAVDRLEQTLGVPVLLFNGILGDVTPVVPEGEHGDDFGRAEAYGNLVAEAALVSLEGTEMIRPALTYSHVGWTQSVDNVLFSLAATLGILQYDFEMDVVTQQVDTQATYLRLGDQVQGVSFPGEPLTRTGMAVKGVMRAPYRVVMGNTGDALGYFILADEWQTGRNDDYEEGVSLGEGAGARAVEVLTELVLGDDFVMRD